MNATEYTKRLRSLATWSWLGALALVVALAAAGVVAFGPFLPFLALLAGAVPIAAFMFGGRPRCEACGGPMRVSVGYPRIAFRCRRCGAEEHTGIHADF
jgi:hypothetical protein